MKTRDELNKMTKQEIINLICNNELLHKVNSIRAITFGTVSFVEAVGNEIKNREHTFMPIIQAFNTVNGDLMIHIPKMHDDPEVKAKRALKCSKAARPDSRPDPEEIVRARGGWVISSTGAWFSRKAAAHRENARLQNIGNVKPDFVKAEF
jgi:hypothetical protein